MLKKNFKNLKQKRPYHKRRFAEFLLREDWQSRKDLSRKIGVSKPTVLRILKQLSHVYIVKTITSMGALMHRILEADFPTYLIDTFYADRSVDSISYYRRRYVENMLVDKWCSLSEIKNILRVDRKTARMIIRDVSSLFEVSVDISFCIKRYKMSEVL